MKHNTIIEIRRTVIRNEMPTTCWHQNKFCVQRGKQEFTRYDMHLIYFQEVAPPKQRIRSLHAVACSVCMCIYSLNNLTVHQFKQLVRFLWNLNFDHINQLNIACLIAFIIKFTRIYGSFATKYAFGSLDIMHRAFRHVCNLTIKRFVEGAVLNFLLSLSLAFCPPCFGGCAHWLQATRYVHLSLLYADQIRLEQTPSNQ